MVVSSSLSHCSLSVGAPFHRRRGSNLGLKVPVTGFSMLGDLSNSMVLLVFVKLGFSCEQCHQAEEVLKAFVCSR